MDYKTNVNSGSLRLDTSRNVRANITTTYIVFYIHRGPESARFKLVSLIGVPWKSLE